MIYLNKEKTKQVNVEQDKDFYELNGDNTYYVYGNVKIIAKDNVIVHAYNNSKVLAYDNSIVNVYDNTKVNAYDTTEVNAYDNSKVNAYDNSKVNANDNSEVDKKTMWQNSNFIITNNFSKYKIKQNFNELKKFVIISKRKRRLKFLTDLRYITKTFCSIEEAQGYLFGKRKIRVL